MSFVLDSVEWVSAFDVAAPHIAALRSSVAAAADLDALLDSLEQELGGGDETSEDEDLKKKKGKEVAVPTPAIKPTAIAGGRPLPRPRVRDPTATPATPAPAVSAALMPPPAVPRPSAAKPAAAAKSAAKRPRASDPESPSRPTKAKAVQKKAKTAPAPAEDDEEAAVVSDTPSEPYVAVDGQPLMRFADAIRFSAQNPDTAVRFDGIHKVSFSDVLPL